MRLRLRYQQIQPGLVLTAAPRCKSGKTSPPGSSLRGATFSTVRSPPPQLRLQRVHRHASAVVCSFASNGLLRSQFPAISRSRHFLILLLRDDFMASIDSDRDSAPWPAASKSDSCSISVRRASGFLQVTLSKVPRPRLSCRSALSRRGTSDRDLTTSGAFHR